MSLFFHQGTDNLEYALVNKLECHHTVHVYAVEFSPDAKYITTAGSDVTVSTGAEPPATQPWGRVVIYGRAEGNVLYQCTYRANPIALHWASDSEHTLFVGYSSGDVMWMSGFNEGALMVCTIYFGGASD